jgi:hypothetical protein
MRARGAIRIGVLLRIRMVRGTQCTLSGNSSVWIPVLVKSEEEIVVGLLATTVLERIEAKMNDERQTGVHGCHRHTNRGTSHLLPLFDVTRQVGGELFTHAMAQKPRYRSRVVEVRSKKPMR